MENFDFCSPTFFAFGRGGAERAGELTKRFGATKVLIHFGGGSAVRSGLIDTVKKSLDRAGIDHIELGGVRPNPRSGLVYSGIELCRRENVDFLLAVGGGSVIDSAKAIAAGTVYDGDFWDFYSGRPVEKALPVGTVLTIPAAGSEGSPNTVITNENGMYKRGASGEVLRPKFSIMDPELTYTLPAYQTACGAVDIMTHVFERYFTNTKDVEITDRLCEAVLITVINETPRALNNPSDYGSRSNIMWAAMLAHNNICGVGRVQDWASHALEHELSALYDVAHGAGLAVIVPAWMKYVMNENIERFAQAAVRIWGCRMNFERPEETAVKGIEMVENFFRSIGMPVSFSELGADEKDIPVLVKNLRVDSEQRIGRFKRLDRKDAERIYRIAAGI